MSGNTNELLIDHLDKTLRGESLAEAEALIRSNPEAREQWQYFNLAVEAVNHEALRARVATIGAEMRAASNMPARRPVIRRLRTVLQIAAAVLLLAGAAAVYKYMSVSPAGLFEDHYTSYELRTTRSGDAASPIEQAYRNQNWKEVVTHYNTLPVKDAKSHFLAGMAHMEQQQFTRAIELFAAVQESNRRNGDNWFRDEAEYYQAMAWLANGQTRQAVAALRAIRSNPGHTFYQKALEISSTDLRILTMK